MGKRKASWRFGAQKRDIGARRSVLFLLLTTRLELGVVLARIEILFTLLSYAFSPPAFVIVSVHVISYLSVANGFER